MRKIIGLATALLGLGLLAAPALAQQKEVTVWSWFIQSTMLKSIAAFEKAHPDVKVNYTYYNYSPEYITALKAAAASGSLPDVIGLQPGSLTQQYRDNLMAVNDIAVKEWGADWADKVFPVNRKQMLMGNPPGDKNYYIVPQESQVLCVWYNRKLFEKLGSTQFRQWITKWISHYQPGNFVVVFATGAARIREDVEENRSSTKRICSPKKEQ